MTREMLLHGGALDLMKARFPDAPLPWIDLSTGINPWPYEGGLDVAAAGRHLPTAAEFEDCAAAMAVAIGVNKQHVLLSPGSELLIRLLPTVVAAKRVCVTARSYGDHASAWRLAGVQLIESNDPLEQIDHCDVVIVCNPNNPDGRRWTREALQRARARLAERGGWLIVDEAYMDLDPDGSVLSESPTDGLIVFRSFGKFYGLAGIRLGALWAPAEITQAMSERLGVWPVSGPTLAIGAQAYRDIDWQDATRQRVSSARKELDRVLSHHGLGVVGGTDLFRLVQVPCAERWWQELGARGIYTRRFKWSENELRFGLPATDAELERLDAALQEINASK
ncbi:MAG: threonine-phosphate decarboxylase CobD [Pseudomonadota bacterium]